jgi:hypothetical protein
MLLDPAISRSRAGVLLGWKTKELVRGCSEAAEQVHPGRWHNP